MHLKEPADPSADTVTITIPLKDATTTTTTSVTEINHKYPRPLYFAFGSNLSSTQMRMRCTHDPDLSSKPVAIAKLDGWRWFICEAGYANVLPPPELRVGRQETDGDAIPISGEEDTVYGILYEMSPEDEFLLDGYEDVDHGASASKSKKVPTGIRPREQGNGDYNKWYFPAIVTKWLDGDEDGDKVQTTLIYIDEERVRVGPPKEEYIGRMNRAIREAELLGFPTAWAEDVMRRFIPDAEG